jgi:hypothetical protein
LSGRLRGKPRDTKFQGSFLQLVGLKRSKLSFSAMKILRLLPIVTALCCAGPSQASFVRPEAVPIDRLLRSAERHLAANPSSPEAHYTLARIHYLAFARNSAEVPAFVPKNDATESQEKPRIAAEWQLLPGLTPDLDRRAFQLAAEEVGFSQPHPSKAPEKFRIFKAAYDRHVANLRSMEHRRQQREHWTNSAALTDQELIKHVTSALAGFRDSIRLLPAGPQARDRTGGPLRAPSHGLGQLGLASLLEQFADWKQLRKPTGLPPELQEINPRQARDAYLTAFRTAYPYDSTLHTRPIEGFEALVSFEAGTAFVRLAELDPAHLDRESELAKALVQVKAGLAKIGQLQAGAVTPVLFSVQGAQSIEELLAPETIVDFDLRGHGMSERWPWLKPHAALLVWDPERSGKIVSARQLFGGYTFEIFWSDGYAALAALDDNDDGELRGSELDGLRLWLDRNADGNSDLGEVRDLSEFGIAGVSVRSVTLDGIHPSNPRGVLFEDGCVFRTWDWIAEPVKKPAPSNPAEL